ncbi:hypothetical protein HV205_06855 [Klebsiella sp. RHBSTW-00465]|nr:hypothetical protein [Klebsiella sp. RHBSTW-00465]MBA7844187.1 hypothetical protein [Klebsiella sp. RHBSTW-00465]
MATSCRWRTVRKCAALAGAAEITDAPRDKCGHFGAINHGHTRCYM